MKKWIGILAVLLAACAGTPFKWDSARQLREGMTEQQVSELMGPPYLVKSDSHGQQWVWSYANSFTGVRTLSVSFKDGKVVKVPQIPDGFQ